MEIKGKILDSNKEPLGSAVVTLISGEDAGKKGKIASNDGTFVLDDENINEDSEFRITYIGYTPKTLKAKDLQDVEIILLEQNEKTPIVDNINRPQVKKTIKEDKKIKESFITHLQDHKMLYATLGFIAGVIIIGLSLKNKNLWKK